MYSRHIYYMYHVSFNLNQFSIVTEGLLSCNNESCPAATSPNPEEPLIFTDYIFSSIISCQFLLCYENWPYIFNHKIGHRPHKDLLKEDRNTSLLLFLNTNYQSVLHVSNHLRPRRLTSKWCTDTWMFFTVCIHQLLTSQRGKLFAYPGGH